MKFIHLLATRGLDLKQAFKIVKEERILKKDHKNISSMTSLFSKVSGFSINELRTLRSHDVVWIKQLAYYYIKERTNLDNVSISKHFNSQRDSVRHGIKQVQNSLDIDNVAKDFYKKIEQQTLKTRKK
jgi:chromosomal replication initiation ATPase DnaA